MATIMQDQTPAQAQPAQGPASTHLFTCNSCQVAFRSSELQRTHMQTDWHRYNLKRKVASLPPLTSEVFTEKVLANQASAAVSAAKATFRKECLACQKLYYSENAYRNHLASQRHRSLTAKMPSHNRTPSEVETESVMSSTFSLGEPLETASTRSQVESVDTTTAPPDAMEVDAVPSLASKHSDAGMGEEITDETLSRCLFCNHQSADVDRNETHMSKNHGMFIPERDYLVDRRGLLTSLYQRITEDHECLLCGQLKNSTAAAQTHMRDRGHCMIAYSSEDDMLAVGAFYDFRSTYSDEDESDEETEEGEGQAGGVKLGAARGTKTTVENEDGEDVEGDEEDEGWESDASSLSSVPTDEITAIPIDDHSHRYKTLDKHRHHSHADPRPHRSRDGYHSHAHPTPHAVYHDEYELHLPSGRVAGHRSLNVFYKQSARPTSSINESRQRQIEGRHDSDDERSRALQRHGRNREQQQVVRANGGLGMLGVSDDKKRMVRAAEKRTQRQAQRAENNYRAGNEKQANSQKHWRDHLLQ